MRRSFTVTNNTVFEGYYGPRLSPDALMARLKRVMEAELTPIQREIMTAFYFDQKTQAQIAAERGITRSSVCRTLKRAENRCQRCLKY
jgi:RNA polymerase sigma factor (sigma-70 family)